MSGDEFEFWDVERIGEARWSWTGEPPRSGDVFTVYEIVPRWVADGYGLRRTGCEVRAHAEPGARLYIPTVTGTALPDVGDVIVWEPPASSTEENPQ
jgi:hypothetical protein